ncbi:MAG: hypothetical protein G5700_04865 [Serratia symbiotica]|nr:hypothetical protein [Serratia symbiotica]
MFLSSFALFILADEDVIFVTKFSVFFQNKFRYYQLVQYKDPLRARRLSLILSMTLPNLLKLLLKTA